MSPLELALPRRRWKNSHCVGAEQHGDCKSARAHTNFGVESKRGWIRECAARIATTHGWR